MQKGSVHFQRPSLVSTTAEGNSKTFAEKKRELRKHLPDLIHNFSDFHLDEHMIALLNKGVNFSITPKTINKSQMKANHNRYSRTMQWKEHHYMKDMNNNNESAEVSVSVEEGVPDVS